MNSDYIISGEPRALVLNRPSLGQTGLPGEVRVVEHAGTCKEKSVGSGADDRLWADKYNTSGGSIDQGTETSHLPPIDLVPDEILCKIFEAGQFSLKQKNFGDSMYFPLLISGVSRRWRQVALDDPFLWTSLSARFCPPYGDAHGSQHSRVFDCMVAYLRRSKMCPVDIQCYFSAYHFDAVPSTKSISRFLGIITQHSARCRGLLFCAERGTFMDTIIAGLENLSSLTCLESLQLIGPYLGPLSTMLPQPRSHFLPPLPALTTLELRFISVRARPTYAEFCDVITSALHLRNLTLHGAFVELDTSLNYPPIPAPTLRSLSIGYLVDDYISIPVLDFLSSPSLECLELIEVHLGVLSAFSQTWNHSPSPRSNKYPAVWSLALTNVYLPNVTDGWLMRTFPLVSHLVVIKSLGFRNAILTVLEHNAQNLYSGPLFWPRLHSLTISSGESDLANIPEFAFARASINKPIRRLRLDSSQLNTPNRRTEMEKIVDVVESFDEKVFVDKMRVNIHETMAYVE